MKRHLLAASTMLATSIIVATPALAQADPQSPPAGSAAQAAGAAAPGTADIADIVVTATRRETSLQKTPLAVSAFTQQNLDRQQVNNVTDLARFVPSLQFNQQGDQSAVLLTLRGIGNDTAFTEVADPEVAIYIDGVYSPRAQGASVLMYDLERVEVSRGPQGTLFGRNATAGALGLISAKPNFNKFGGYAEAIAGDYNRIGTRGAVNVPISDTLAARFAFVTERHDGYADFQPAPNVPNVDRSAFITTGKKYYAQDQMSGRISLLWQPSSRFTWNLSAEGFLDKGAPVIALLQTPRPGTQLFSTLSDTAPDTDRYSVAVRSTMDFDVTDDMQVTYIAGFSRLGGSTQADADAGAMPPTGGFDPVTGNQLFLGGFGENRTVRSRYDFTSHELQLKSTGDHTIDYIFGRLLFAREQQHPLRRRPARRLSRWRHAGLCRQLHPGQAHDRLARRLRPADMACERRDPPDGRPALHPGLEGRCRRPQHHRVRLPGRRRSLLHRQFLRRLSRCDRRGAARALPAGQFRDLEQ